MMKQHTTAATSFLPEDYLQRKSEARANAINLVLFGVVLFGVIGAFFVTNQQWSSVRARQAQINQEYMAETQKLEQLRLLEAQKREMIEKAEITAALLERVPRSILMAELINRMPERLTLTEVSLQSRRIKEEPKKPAAAAAPKSLSAKPGGGAPGSVAAPEPAPRPRPPKMEFTVVLIGLSPADTDIADYHTALKDCPLIDRVEMVSSIETKVDETMMRKFRLEAQIRVDADARRIEPLQVPRLRMAASPGVPPAGDTARAPHKPMPIANVPTDKR
ncbi:MAG: hypothetical protein KIT68_06690 [Phycisphaeraceae bacterium]|nr:hypothetical protein [Phycisphaeraceae bacterium]